MNGLKCSAAAAFVGMLLAAPQYGAAADDACSGFTWNVVHERALFATAPQGLTAGLEVSSAPRVSTERLYDLALSPQEQVHFAKAPGKRPRGEHPFAGLVRLRVSVPGMYRVSASQTAWIDVIAAELALASVDFQGQSGCRTPHKIVQFALPAGKDLTLQVSGAELNQVELTVTPVPAAG